MHNDNSTESAPTSIDASASSTSPRSGKPCTAWSRRNPPAAQAALWRYRELRPFLLEAGDLISAEEVRRVLVLENPDLPGQSAITPSLYAGLQLILPGEIAPATGTPSRPCASSSRATAPTPPVDGERTRMEPGDFIITPSWTWHDTATAPARAAGGEPVVWLDGLDIRCCVSSAPPSPRATANRCSRCDVAKATASPATAATCCRCATSRRRRPRRCSATLRAQPRGPRAPGAPRTARSLKATSCATSTRPPAAGPCRPSPPACNCCRPASSGSPRAAPTPASIRWWKAAAWRRSAAGASPSRPRICSSCPPGPSCAWKRRHRLRAVQFLRPPCAAGARHPPRIPRTLAH